MSSLVRLMMLMKSWWGFEVKSNSFRISELVGTRVLYYKNSRIEFSHIIMWFGLKVKQLSAIIASKVKPETSCLSSIYCWVKITILLYLCGKSQSCTPNELQSVDVGLNVGEEYIDVAESHLDSIHAEEVFVAYLKRIWEFEVLLPGTSIGRVWSSCGARSLLALH